MIITDVRTPFQTPALQSFVERERDAVPPKAEFTFIDLFAGIGGTRLAFEIAGGECVFSCEWDKYACKTYEANFGESPEGDVTQISLKQLKKEVGKYDVLVGGFPCQPFSLAGVTKHTALGNEHGFKHPTQGTLFFELVKILKATRPRAFLLENVKNLKSHDRGKTFKVIIDTLEKELKYDIHHEVIDARNKVPQHRERTYIVGFRKKTKFKFPDLSENVQPPRPQLRAILDSETDPKYTLSEHLWGYLQDYADKHRAKGNGFGFGLIDPHSPENADVVTRTLSARYHKDGSEILIDTGGDEPRRLTPRECARLMGFPEEFRIDKVSDTQAYRQFGNSVVVPVVTEIARAMTKHLA